MFESKEVIVQIRTLRTEFPTSLFDCSEEEIQKIFDEKGTRNHTADISSSTEDEMIVEGRLLCPENGVRLEYTECDRSGMEGTKTSISTSFDHPEVVFLKRTGTVNTSLIFETGIRHFCKYRTPYSDFDICIHSFQAENKLLQSGTLLLDYAIEIHGVPAERCKMVIRLLDKQN